MERGGRGFGAWRWAVRCVVALAIFQAFLALVLFGNPEQAARDLATDDATAEVFLLGRLVARLVLAALCAALAWALSGHRLRTRLLGTVLLGVIALGEIAAMAVPTETYLSPIGAALALISLVLIWTPPAEP